jgi:hypothetical protein
MRSSTISNLALLATSLLAKEVLAGRYDMRLRAAQADVVVTDDVLVTEEITVVEEADGSYETGVPVVIGTTTITTTIDGTPVVYSSTATPAASSVVPPTVPAAATTPAAATSAASTSSATFSSAVSSPSAAPISPEVPSAGPIKALAEPAAAALSNATGAIPTILPQSTPTTTLAAAPVTPTTSSTPAAAPTTLATSTSSSASSAPTSTSSGGSTSGNKRGLAYNAVDLLESFLGSNSKTSWCYNWGSTSGGSVPSGLEYVPMLWGLESTDTSGWQAAASSAIASGSTHLLSFNEPDNTGQANLGYADAATGYMANMQPFAGKAKLGAPAVTNGPSAQGEGMAWLGSFLTACSSCTIDFVPLHWYDSATNIDYFKSYIMNAHSVAGNRPLWITEFGASGSPEEQQTFLQEVMPWLDSLGYVERYAYFMVSDGNLLSSGSALSTLGETFAFS